VTPKEKYGQKLTEDQRYELMVELYANELSMEEIMAEFGISKSFLYSINAGKKHPIEDYKLSMVEIGNEFGVSKALISKINRGEKYAIDGYDYPVRGTE